MRGAQSVGGEGELERDREEGRGEGRRERAGERRSERSSASARGARRRTMKRGSAELEMRPSESLELSERAVGRCELLRERREVCEGEDGGEGDGVERGLDVRRGARGEKCVLGVQGRGAGDRTPAARCLVLRRRRARVALLVRGSRPRRRASGRPWPMPSCSASDDLRCPPAASGIRSPTRFQSTFASVWRELLVTTKANPGLAPTRSAFFATLRDPHGVRTRPKLLPLPDYM